MKLFIGIDTGTKTGLAVWDTAACRLLAVDTLSITQAMERVRQLAGENGKVSVRLFIEDARQRKWFGNTDRERLKGAGSVCRDAAIWEDWCKEQGLEYEMVAPRHNLTKLKARQFALLTGWKGRTSEHGRDAAMMVYGRQENKIL